jgi:hypothetical protein
MSTIQLKSAITAQADASAAAEDLLTQLGGISPKLVTLFASPDRDHRALNRAVRERLPSTTRLIGATAAGQINRQGTHEGSVVLGALTGDFEVGIGLGKGLSEDAITAGAEAVAKACSELGVKQADLDPRRHVGVVIDDASKMKKEELLLGMLEKNQALTLVGGGASDHGLNPAQMKCMVHVDGEVADDAALAAIFSTPTPFAALRSHWYKPTGKSLTITKVDDTHTRALEIDGKPAAVRYAELLGVEVPDLEYGRPTGFSSWPTALRVGREYFVRTPVFTLPDNSIAFMNMLDEGSVYELLTTSDMVESTKHFFEKDVPARVQSPQAAIIFNCGARALLGTMAGKAGELSKTFESAPNCVGFNVSFEIYCGFNINTTLTALVFGQRP